MAELLIELFCEEIPALMQKQAECGYKGIFTKILQKHEIKFERLEIFISSRRIVIHITGLDTIISAKNMEFKGPAITANKNAIEGFCRSHNITINDLSQKIIKEQSFYIYTQIIKEQKIEALLTEIIPVALKEYVWPKSMNWGDYDLTFVRPLKNILCLFDNKVLPFKFYHLTANDITYGHRFMSNSHSGNKSFYNDAKNITSRQVQDDFSLTLLKVLNFAQYKTALFENYVIFDRKERIKIITEQLIELANKHNLTIKNDDNLLEEVAGLVEYPVAMIGKIEERFLSLPAEVLITSIRTHQKYFSCLDNKGNFAPYFLFISNIKSAEPELIINGNQKVLRARLSDALYFYKKDSTKTLESFLATLKSMSFHSKLGSIEEKTHRIAKICLYLDPENVELQLAARLCKSDLASQMVGEFPELQGIMGYYYALNENLSENIALAIKDHYKPQGPDSPVPVSDSALLSIADKIDSMVGLMLAGEIPTGSKDPYALRRMALGIIRIILENNLNIDLKNLVSFTYNLYNINSNSAPICHFAPLGHSCEGGNPAFSQEWTILSFFEERLKNYYKNEYEHNLLQSLVDLSKQGNLVIIYLKLAALKDFLSTQKGQQIIAIYKRVNNITASKNPEGQIKPELFASDYEKNLYQLVENIHSCTKYYSIEDERIIKNRHGHSDFSYSHPEFISGSKIKQHNITSEILKQVQDDIIGFLKLLESLLKPINDFFDNIMVIDENVEIANNRLLLLLEVKNLFHKMAKFDLL